MKFLWKACFLSCLTTTVYGNSENELKIEPDRGSFKGCTSVHIANHSTNASYLVVLDSLGRLPPLDPTNTISIQLLDKLPIRDEGYFCVVVKPGADSVAETGSRNKALSALSTNAIDSVFVLRADSRINTITNRHAHEVDLKAALDGTIRFQGTNVVCRIWNNGSSPVLLRMDPFPSSYNSVSFRPQITAVGPDLDCVLQTGLSFIEDGTWNPRYYFVLLPREHSQIVPRPFVEWTSSIPKNMDRVPVSSCSSTIGVRYLSIVQDDSRIGLYLLKRGYEVIKLRFETEELNGGDQNAARLGI